MKLIKTIAAALCMSALMIPLSACEETGEKIDDTVEDAGEAVEDATDGN